MRSQESKPRNLLLPAGMEDRQPVFPPRRHLARMCVGLEVRLLIAESVSIF